MPEAAESLALGAEFPQANRAQWLELVEATLKGAPFDKKLVARTYDGLRIEPLYARDPHAAPMLGRAPGLPWQVMQRVDHPEPAAANAEALHDLKNGASGLSLVFAGSAGAYGFGLPPTADALARALDGVYLDAIPLEFDFSPQAKDAAMQLARFVTERGFSPKSVQVRFGFDPLGALAQRGALPIAWANLAPSFAAIVRDLAAAGFKGPFAAADGRIMHAAGGSEAQELAFALAAALAYLRALESGGVALEDARRMIFFRLAADADQFLTMAKFRAVRRLWARVEEACGLAPAPVFVSAETAWRMMTRRDPWVNMLRTTIATFSAGLAGADAVSVLPFTAALGLPDRFARRIARNTQTILLDESNLARVADPALGSGALETLTRQLGEAAWVLFQEIEAAGGVGGALERGFFQQKVATVRQERETAVARRKDALTGTSEFPNLLEEPVKVLEAKPVALPAPNTGGFSITPMPSYRAAEPFEALRDASDALLARTGARPKAFLANLGPLAAFTARAMYAKNFFEAGGIEAVSNDGFGSTDGATDLAALAAAFKASGAALACLCSSDDIYAAEAVAAAQALAAAGARAIYLAGRPGALEASLKAAGVHAFVHVGCDALETLRAAHDRITDARV